MFQHEFENVVLKYGAIAKPLFTEIRIAYTQPSRHYHTLAHLDQLLADLKPHQSQFSCWDTVVFAIAYHDFVYKATRKDNEENSGAVAEARLRQIDFPEDETKQCVKFILATKKHEAISNEIDLFTDADLSILGASPEKYQQYATNVRREYSIYPDLLYKPGRKKVLQHFLSMRRIYKTDEFYERYEQAARCNLQTELEKVA
jgi:predicted metal-dependent HD superfamily phosphohydrolase